MKLTGKDFKLITTDPKDLVSLTSDKIQYVIPPEEKRQYWTVALNDGTFIYTNIPLILQQVSSLSKAEV